jgi:tol-pal system protein YbgF
MKLIKIALSVAALTLASGFAYAEHTAPVYDVDGMSNDGQTSPEGAQQDSNARAAMNQALTTSSEPPATIEQRLDRIEQQFATEKQSEMANRLNSMQGEVQALRGQVEELTHQLQEMHNQQQAQHFEADKIPNRDLTEQTVSPLPRVGDDEAVNTTRSKSLAKTNPPSEKPIGSNASNAEHRATKLAKKASAPEKVAAAEQPNVAEEQAVYQTAYNLIKVKKYNEAIGTLQKMLVKYPSGQFAANAHYWLGELYSLTSENEKAASEFNLVVKQYPNNPRVADAELKLGLIDASQLKWPAAKASFKKVISKYPGTTSARLAMEQLKQLKQAGH